MKNFDGVTFLGTKIEQQTTKGKGQWVLEQLEQIIKILKEEEE
jgi:hypothetical protein